MKLHPLQFWIMVALVRDLDGKVVNMHRTYLTPQGEKADIPEPRRVMPLPMPKGCAVRLSPPTDVLGIAEGIETAAAVTALFGVPCWAALNAENLKGWVPPEGVRVVIYGDNDFSWTGHEAAYSLGRKLRAKNLNVQIKIPDTERTDWNDVLLRQGSRVRNPVTEAAE